MKISNSKKQLAKIISENGGWRDVAKFAWFQGKLKGGPCHEVWFGEENSEPEYVPASGSFHSYWSMVVDKFPATKFDNWHQTVLARDEYFHLYPAPDADGWIAHDGKHEPAISESGLTLWCKWSDGLEDAHEAKMVSWIDDSENRVVAYRLHKPEHAEQEYSDGIKPTDPAKQNPAIEQLAAEYRNRKDYAERKQQEADAAKEDAEAKLAELVAAGEAVGLVLSVAAPEPELIITDIDDLIEGDVIELTAGERYNKTECTMVHIDGVGLRAKSASDTRNRWWNLDGHQESEWRFIRRPAKEAANA